MGLVDFKRRQLQPIDPQSKACRVPTISAVEPIAIDSSCLNDRPVTNAEIDAIVLLLGDDLAKLLDGQA